MLVSDSPNLHDLPRYHLPFSLITGLVQDDEQLAQLKLVDEQLRPCLEDDLEKFSRPQELIPTATVVSFFDRLAVATRCCLQTKAALRRAGGLSRSRKCCPCTNCCPRHAGLEAWALFTVLLVGVYSRFTRSPVSLTHPFSPLLFPSFCRRMSWTPLRLTLRPCSDSRASSAALTRQNRKAPAMGWDLRRIELERHAETTPLVR